MARHLAPAPLTQPYEFRARASNLVALRRLEESAETAREGLSQYPDYVPLHTILSFVLHDSGDGKGALAAAEQALALAPDDGEAKAAYGAALMLLGRSRKAVPAIKEALATHPTPFLHVLLGQHYLRKVAADPFFVMRYRNDDLRLVDRSGLPLNSRAEGEDMRLAEKHARAALRLAPNYVEGHVLRGEIHLVRHAYGDAEHWARSALKIAPETPGGHELLGAIAERRGRYAAAGDHYVEVGRLDPRSRSGIERLRRLGSTVAGFALLLPAYWIISLRSSGRDVGTWWWAVAALAIGILVGFRYVPALWARRRISAQARDVLARDRRMRWAGRSWRAPFRRR